MLIIDKNQVHFAFDPSIRPCAAAESGDTVKFCCQDCFSEQLLTDHFDVQQIDMDRTNPPPDRSSSAAPSPAMCCGWKFWPLTWRPMAV
ncbi:MAG TPA: hypothetical protein PKW33_00225 [Anaerolineaceae bacterium]|nr:hypothetical protein [Anaerolineaceae bacterium]HPN49982.1 hypothetical protein [Anaerolineaceae bacterium]